MINQAQPVYNYTIPYYTSSNGETDELFVSEKTYENYLFAAKNEKVIIIKGPLHPISSKYGAVTSTLFDLEKTIVVIGTQDLQEYTNELLDITIAQELEKVLLIEKTQFFRFLYHQNTPENIQTFIDDIQQTLEEIQIAKRLQKTGYRIIEREEFFANEIFENAVQWRAFRNVSPYENEHTIFLVIKLFFLAYVANNLFQQYKKQLHHHYPQLFVEVEKLLHLTKKLNLSTFKGRERALVKIFTKLNYIKYIKKVTLKEIDLFQLKIIT